MPPPHTGPSFPLISDGALFFLVNRISFANVTRGPCRPHRRERHSKTSAHTAHRAGCPCGMQPSPWAHEQGVLWPHVRVPRQALPPSGAEWDPLGGRAQHGPGLGPAALSPQVRVPHGPRALAQQRVQLLPGGLQGKSQLAGREGLRDLPGSGSLPGPAPACLPEGTDILFCHVNNSEKPLILKRMVLHPKGRQAWILRVESGDSTDLHPQTANRLPGPPGGSCGRGSRTRGPGGAPWPGVSWLCWVRGLASPVQPPSEREAAHTHRHARPHGPACHGASEGEKRLFLKDISPPSPSGVGDQEAPGGWRLTAAPGPAR